MTEPLPFFSSPPFLTLLPIPCVSPDHVGFLHAWDRTDLDTKQKTRPSPTPFPISSRSTMHMLRTYFASPLPSHKQTWTIPSTWPTADATNVPLLAYSKYARRKMRLLALRLGFATSAGFAHTRPLPSPPGHPAWCSPAPRSEQAPPPPPTPPTPVPLSPTFSAASRYDNRVVRSCGLTPVSSLPERSHPDLRPPDAPVRAAAASAAFRTVTAFCDRTRIVCGWVSFRPSRCQAFTVAHHVRNSNEGWCW